tara:strand:+ start:47 stop:181 length:135 start_codon:yes stop_codon:yes gene_type:complete
MKTTEQEIKEIIAYHERLKNPEPCKAEDFSPEMIKAHNIKFESK